MLKTSLNYQIIKNPSKKTVLLLHGFTQTSLSWEPLVEQFKTNFQIILVDLPGHGLTNEVLASEFLFNELNDFSFDYLIGYSMGARISLSYFTSKQFSPEIPVEKMVLISPSCGEQNFIKRYFRYKKDLSLAQKLLQMSENDIENFYKSWLSQPLFRTLKPEDALIKTRTTNLTSLANALLTYSQAKIYLPFKKLKQIKIPVLIIAGQLDEKYYKLATKMMKYLANAELITVPDSTHAPHLEKPDLVGNIIAEFLNR